MGKRIDGLTPRIELTPMPTAEKSKDEYTKIFWKEIAPKLKEVYGENAVADDGTISPYIGCIQTACTHKVGRAMNQCTYWIANNNPKKAREVLMQVGHSSKQAKDYVKKEINMVKRNPIFLDMFKDKPMPKVYEPLHEMPYDDECLTIFEAPLDIYAEYIRQELLMDSGDYVEKQN